MAELQLTKYRYLVLFLGLTLFSISRAEQFENKNIMVFGVIVDNEDQLSVLKNLHDSSEPIIFLHSNAAVNQTIRLMVLPRQLDNFEQSMKAHGISYKHLSTNLQHTSIRSELSPRRLNLTINWTRYHQLSTCYAWLANVSATFSNQTKMHFIGRSAENRDIVVFQIKPSAEELRRPIIFIEAGLYGNEWIAPATATYIIDQLLTSQDEDVRNIAAEFEWYILPHANPDGYEYSYNTDRLWRKNRRKVDEWCYGVDLNRNFDFRWDDGERHNNTCSNTYPGPRPLSEPETYALSQFISTLRTMGLYISLQGFSQKLVYPSGYISAPLPNEPDVQRVAEVATKSLRERYGTNYTSGSLYNTVHPVPGNSMDWTYTTQGVNMAFTFMLRPAFGSKYQVNRMPPAGQILPTAVETFDSLMAMIAEIKSLGYFD